MCAVVLLCVCGVTCTRDVMCDHGADGKSGGAARCQWSQWAGMPSVSFYFQVNRHEAEEERRGGMLALF